MEKYIPLPEAQEDEKDEKDKTSYELAKDAVLNSQQDFTIDQKESKDPESTPDEKVDFLSQIKRNLDKTLQEREEYYKKMQEIGEIEHQKYLEERR